MSLEPPRRCVLVVEDNLDIREMLEEILGDEGYAVVTAVDGMDALAYLQKHPPPCLILIDLMMPRMDGWEFRARLSQDPALAAIPLVVVTGAEVAGLDPALTGAEYLPKPVDLSALLALVERYCGTPGDSGGSCRPG